MAKPSGLTSVLRCTCAVLSNNHLLSGNLGFLYGYEPNLGIISDSGNSTTLEATVSDLLQEREVHTVLLKEQLAFAQNRMKLQADKHRVDRQFIVGDKVLLNLQPYAQTSVVNRPYPKLSYKYFGPFEILEIVGAAAYKLCLPIESKSHNVFHVSQLKPFTPDHTPVFSDIIRLPDLTAHLTEPETILERRLVKKGNSAVPQVLVKWSQLPVTSAMWEEFYVLQKAFPAASAWGQGCGQAASQGAAPVMAQTSTTSTAST